MSLAGINDYGTQSGSWHFVVSETRQHPKGFTLYKVTLQLVPVDISAQIQEVFWWKRYSDFLPLHKNLSALHAALYLKGSFPTFPKPTVLRKKDEQIIEERRAAAEKLLKFISTFPILRKNEHFKDFLKGGESVLHKSGCDPTEPLEPIRLQLVREAEKAHSFSEDEFQSEFDLPLSPVSDLGVWRHLLKGDDEQESICSFDSPESSELIQSPSSDVALGGDTDFALNPAESFLTSSADLLSDLLPSSTMLPNEEDYLFLAGHHLSRASAKEALGDFELAFGMYKLGIDILLKGVQNDEDPVRRDAVRRKAAKYLTRAEKIFSEHLSSESEPEIYVDFEYATIAGTRSDLMEYMVVRSLSDGVLLVKHRVTHEIFVIKSLTKASSVRKDVKNIVPLGPRKFMVQLVRVVETSNKIYLILEKARGGNLWTYIREYGSNPEVRRSSRLVSQTNSPNLQLDAFVFRNQKSAKPKELSRSQKDDYISLFLKYAGGGDGDRSRSSSLVQVDQAVQDSPPDLPSPVQETDWRGEVFGSQSSDGKQSRDATETDHFNDRDSWKTVGELDSEELIRKSKQLIESVDKTIERTISLISTKDASRTTDQPPSITESHSSQKSIAHVDSGDDMFESEESSAEIKDDLEGEPLKRIPESLARTWIAEVITAVEDLHSEGLFCQKLCMDNVMLGEKGHIKLTYFSQWNSLLKNVFDQGFDYVDVNYYMAPELRRVGVELNLTKCDIWSIGVILFEILVGQKFDRFNAGEISEYRSLMIPASISCEANDLLKKMLSYHSDHRPSFIQIKQHVFFKGFDWSSLNAR